MSSKIRAKKFYTGDASPPRSGKCFLLVVANFPREKTNQKVYSDLRSDVSSVWNFCTRSSDVILRGNQWWRRGICKNEMKSDIAQFSAHESNLSCNKSGCYRLRKIIAEISHKIYTCCALYLPKKVKSSPY